MGCSISAKLRAPGLPEEAARSSQLAIAARIERIESRPLAGGSA